MAGVSDSISPSSAADPRIARYESWISTLEGRTAKLAETRKQSLFFFGGAVLVSGLGFFFSPWFGTAALITGIMFCVSGLYIVFVRSNEYQKELEVARRELSRLRRTSG